MATEKRTDRVIPVAEGPEHGYWGQAVDETDRSAYTVAGQTGGTTANVSDSPKRSKSSGYASGESRSGSKSKSGEKSGE